MNKYIHFTLITFILIIIDQFSKIWIKTHLNYYENFSLFPNLLEIQFVENEGMAMGLKYGGNFGKVNLTVTRFFISLFLLGIIYYLNLKKAKNGLILAFCFLCAGLFGNMIDNIFYDSLFEYNSQTRLFEWSQEFKIERLFFGKVVDMIFIPIIPYFIFNLADFFVTAGIGLLFMYRNYLFLEVYKFTEMLRHEN